MDVAIPPDSYLLIPLGKLLPLGRAPKQPWVHCLQARHVLAEKKVCSFPVGGLPGHNPSRQSLPHHHWTDALQLKGARHLQLAPTIILLRWVAALQ